MSEQYKNIEITRIKRTVRTTEGVPLLICAADKVSVDGMSRINELYGKVCDNCLEYCERELARHCQPPSVYAYKLACKAREDDGMLTVTLTATFTDRSARKVISTATYTHTWDKEENLRKKKNKKVKKNKTA